MHCRHDHRWTLGVRHNRGHIQELRGTCESSGAALLKMHSKTQTVSVTFALFGGGDLDDKVLNEIVDV